MAIPVVQRPVIAQLRSKNQLTLPDQIVKGIGAEVGDKFSVSIEGDAIVLDRVRKSYYGALKGLWPENWMDDLRRDRDSWRP